MCRLEFGHRTEERVVGVDELVRQRRTGRGELHEGPSPTVRVQSPGEQALALEGAQRVSDRRLRDRKLPGEASHHRLRRRSIVQCGDEVRLERAQLLGRRDVLTVGASRTGQPVERLDELLWNRVAAIADRGRDSHDSLSVEVVDGATTSSQRGSASRRPIAVPSVRSSIAPSELERIRPARSMSTVEGVPCRA